jgi:tRNA pseudouridine55 synthase
MDPPATRTDRCGLLVLDKPPGITSHDAVDRVRRRLRIRAAGHLGTLDPGATGLLLVATGAATRCAPVWQGGDKTYEAALLFGVVTTSQDVHGEVLERRVVDLDEARVRQAALGLTGEQEQVPPMVSAIKMGGERLYRLARRGIEVERAPRRVTVRRWEWLGFDLPTAHFRLVCSCGTYVRTLAHDLGQRLGCGAALSELRRLRSEPFGLERGLPLDELSRLDADEVWARAGYSLEESLAHLPTVRLEPDASDAIGYGARPAIPRAGHPLAPLAGGPRSVVFRGPDDRVLALGELIPETSDPSRAIVCAHVVFPWTVRQGKPL